MNNSCEVPETVSPDPRTSIRLGGAAPSGLVVRKYGGSSLATPELVRAVATKIATAAERGQQVVVVVSAMGATTDDLVTLAGKVAIRPDPRELDQLMATGEQASAAVLALALQRRGVKAVSLSGDQAGVVVDGPAGDAVIAHVDASRIFDRLREAQVVVVAGFQGRDRDGELRTLGRGGSDTTAVALAAALGVSCEIYTDVKGVHTADPRIVRDSTPLPSVSYRAMTELAGNGARVLHPRSVALAERRAVPLLVTHSAGEGAGTTVEDAPPLEAGPEVVGIAHERQVRLVRLTCGDVPRGRCARALVELIGLGLRPDVLTWHAPGDLRFTARGQAASADVVREVAERLGARCEIDDGFGSISVVGVALLDDPRYLIGLLRAAAEPDAAVPAMATSPSRLTAVVPARRIEAAVGALHRAFGLHQPQGARR
ncbi:aspartate kinase [Amycolatopsis minnesotensis]|uniref:Aspartokinase n=1 Tax=Amycolatopsis minnesotensis TaxID=337894 RepID=A0ABN2R6E1_9PSEU